MNRQEMLAAHPDIWACPACEEGWQTYMIAKDMNVCSKCGYKGGPLPESRKILAPSPEPIDGILRA